MPTNSRLQRMQAANRAAIKVMEDAATEIRQWPADTQLQHGLFMDMSARLTTQAHRLRRCHVEEAVK